MSHKRATPQAKAAAQVKPAATVHRSATATSAAALSSGPALQQRLGNRGARDFAAQVVARSSAPGFTSTGGASLGQFAVSQPDDAQEREADRVADVVMRTTVRGSTSSSPSMPTVQRACSDCEEEISTRGRAGQPVVAGDANHVHRSASAYGASQVSTPVAASIHDMQGGGGAPLPAATRTLFEPRFGADFSHVRVHTGGRADSTAKAINAKAFTVGSDIVFAGGHYSPESHEGQRLLAHELTHVVQQSPRKMRRDVQRLYGHTTAQAVHSTGQVQRRSAGVIVQRDLLDDIGKAVSDKASSVVGAVSNLASDVVDTASSVIDRVKERLQQALDAGIGQINATWALVKGGATTAVNGAIAQASGFLSGIGALFGAVGTALRSLDVDSLRAVWGAITGTADAALAGVRVLVAQATAAVDGLWSGLKRLANGVIGGLQTMANGLIGRLPGAVQGLARSLWSRIEARLTNAWRVIESEWLSVREWAVRRVNQLVAMVAAVVRSLKNSVIRVIIDTLDRLRHLFAFFKRLMANPGILIDPVVKDITGRLQGLPEKSRAYIQAKVRENATGGPGTVAAAPVAVRIAPVTGPTSAPSASSISRVIQRTAAPAGHPRSTLGVGEVISGCWDFLTDKLGALWASLGTMIKEMVLSLIWPPATWEALKKDWTQMTEELSTRVSRFDSIRTDTWDGFSEDIRRFLSNLADFPLIVWRAANGMLGHLSVYIGLALVLGGAIAGAIAVATGGAIFGSVVPAAGTAAGAGLGLGAGFLAGAAAGYAAAETVGLILLASFISAEQFSIFKSLGDLLGVPQSEAEQKEDFSQATDSTIAIVTAGLLMLIAFVGVALAKRVWAFVKSIPGRFRPKPKVVEPQPTGPKPVEPTPGSVDKLVICRVCDVVPGVPADLMAQRAKLSPEMRQFLDSKAVTFFPDPSHPTPSNFKALRGFMEGAAKKGGGDLEAGLRQIAPKAPPSGPPRGAGVGELPRLRQSVERLIAEIEDFAKANPDKPGIEKSATRLREQLEGPVSNMENGRLEATPEQVQAVDRAVKGAQGELEQAKVAPPGTKFSEIIDGVEIDQIRPDGTLVQVVKVRALRNPSKTFSDRVAQVKRTLMLAQNNPVNGRPRQVVYEFPEGLSKDVAADLRGIEVNGQHATINAPEIIVPPK